MSPPAPDAPPPSDSLRRPTRWRSLARRFAPLVALVAVALLAYWSGLPQKLSPAALGREHAQLQALVGAHPVLTVGGFILGYALLTGACLPVALMLSLAGGLVFGTWLGGAAILLGGAGGAIITYAAARSAFAPLLLGRARHDPRLQSVIQGFGRSAFTYVLTLRLLPVVPFALVNIASGLAAVPLRAYALATLAGGVPTALIYAGLGAGLGEAIGSQAALKAALRSPQLLGPLAALALLSLAPLLLTRLRRRN
ncbi:VTT domain-containing protein [Phenylobacterium sp. LjRoot225]|uniref:TVP38/TMEM64 family protein n=1 Tax=Phenylobacterium sp. LjRoot225 TaxID=3342285 RepID=UPI003ECEA08C